MRRTRTAVVLATALAGMNSFAESVRFGVSGAILGPGPGSLYSVGGDLFLRDAHLLGASLGVGFFGLNYALRARHFYGLSKTATGRLGVSLGATYSKHMMEDTSVRILSPWVGGTFVASDPSNTLASERSRRLFLSVGTPLQMYFIEDGEWSSGLFPQFEGTILF